MAWQAYNDSLGRHNDVWLQQRTESCGPSCCMMLARIIRSMRMDSEESMRLYVDKVEKNAWEAAFTYERPSWNAAGTLPTSISHVLTILKINGVYTDRAAPATVCTARASFHKPAIMFVSWNAGGFHFIVCRGTSTAGNTLFLDPGQGLVEVPTATLPTYGAGTLVAPSITTS